MTSPSTVLSLTRSSHHPPLRIPPLSVPILTSASQNTKATSRHPIPPPRIYRLPQTQPHLYPRSLESTHTRLPRTLILYPWASPPKPRQLAPKADWIPHIHHRGTQRCIVSLPQLDATWRTWEHRIWGGYARQASQSRGVDASPTEDDVRTSGGSPGGSV